MNPQEFRAPCPLTIGDLYHQVADLQEQIIVHTSTYGSRPSPEQRAVEKEYREQVERLTQKIEDLETLARFRSKLYPSPHHDNTREFPAQSDGAKMGNISLLSNLSAFIPNSSEMTATSYIKDFERAAALGGVPLALWGSHLLLKVPKTTPVYTRLERVEGQGWEVVKQTLLEYYRDPLEQEKAHLAFFTFSRHPHESWDDTLMRFEDICTRTQQDVDSIMVLTRLLALCPPVVRDAVRTKQLIQAVTFQEVSRIIRDHCTLISMEALHPGSATGRSHASPPSKQVCEKAEVVNPTPKPSTTNPLVNNTPTDHPSPTATGNGRPKLTRQYCEEHGSCFHSTEECRVRKRSMNHLAVDGVDHLLQLPVQVNGQMLIAFPDGGANISAISPSLRDQLQVMTVAANLDVTGFTTDCKSRVVEKANLVVIRSNGKNTISAEITVYVVENLSHPFMIGYPDLMKLGISVYSDRLWSGVTGETPDAIEQPSESCVLPAEVACKHSCMLKSQSSGLVVKFNHNQLVYIYNHNQKRYFPSFLLVYCHVGSLSMTGSDDLIGRGYRFLVVIAHTILFRIFTFRRCYWSKVLTLNLKTAISIGSHETTPQNRIYTP